jgi:hypothetical protein
MLGCVSVYIGVVSVYMQYMVYNCVYYCDTYLCCFDSSRMGSSRYPLGPLGLVWSGLSPSAHMRVCSMESMYESSSSSMLVC